MLIIPAIDLINGQCVRLYQGKYDKVTKFDSDPVTVAKKFKKNGAQWLHVIDLDGARIGKLVNLKIVEKIKKDVNLKIEFGGGIRDVQTINKLINLKIDKLILSTAVINDPGIINKINPKKIIISLDAKNDRVMIKGWQKKSKYGVIELIKKFTALKVNNFIYTDIEKDGTLMAPNLKKIARLRRLFPHINLEIAGGISSAKDLQNLNSLKINAAIIGQALYVNKELNNYVSQKNYTLPGC